MAKRPEPIDLESVTASTLNRQKPDGRWYWRARRTDTRETVWAGWGTRLEVVAALSALLTKGLPQSRRRSELGAVRTVGDLLDRGLAHQQKRHEAGAIADKSLEGYTYAVRHWKAEPIAEVLASRLTRALVSDQCLAWGAAGLAPRTIKRDLDVLVMIINWGAERGYCPDVNLSRLESLSVKDDEHVNCGYTPTPAQAAYLLAEGMPQDELTDAIRLLALTGARVGEVAALKVGDYARATGRLRLKGADEQRGRRGKHPVRYFPLRENGRAVLDRITAGRGAEERLFAGLQKHLSDQINDRLAECAGVELDGDPIPRFTCHGLRRMAVMEMLEGSNAKNVSKLTGHSVATLLRFYVRPTEGSLENTVAKSGLDALMTGEAGKVIEGQFGHRNRAQSSGADE
jgi:integrase